MNTVYPKPTDMNEIHEWLKTIAARYIITLDNRRYPELHLFSEQDYLLYVLRWQNA